MFNYALFLQLSESGLEYRRRHEAIPRGPKQPQMRMVCKRSNRNYTCRSVYMNVVPKIRKLAHFNGYICQDVTVLRQLHIQKCFARTLCAYR